MFPGAPWLVWLLPLGSSLLVPIFARIGKRALNIFVVIVGVVTTTFAFSMIPDIFLDITIGQEYNVPWIEIPPMMAIDAGVVLDPLSVLFASLVAFFSLVIIIYSIGYMAEEKNLTRYYFFIILFIGSMIGLVMSDNFFQMFVFWEMVGLCSYQLISFYSHKQESVHSGLKAFLMTRIGDVLLLAAIILLYVSTGSFSFSYIAGHLSSITPSTLTAVAFLMLGGALVKSSQLPLYTWLYSAMEAPASVSALLHGATMVKAGIYLLARIIIIFGNRITEIPGWLETVAWVGAITGLLGAILAVHTNDIKGVPAFSTVSQLGFMFAALGTVTSQASLGWFAGLFHLFSHAFFQGLGFLAIGGIIHSIGTRDMQQMGGLRKKMPITFLLCIIVVLARTGVPPFASFFSKGLILSSLWTTNNIPLVFTVYAGMALTFSYTLRFIILVFFRKESELVKAHHLHEPPKLMLFAAGILAALCCAWGFMSPLIAQFMHVDVEFGFSEIFSPSTLIFLLILCIGGIPVLLVYYNNSRPVQKTRAVMLAVLDKPLKHGLYFDDFFERVVVRGITKVASGINDKLEKGIFYRLPIIVANGAVRLATGIRKYLDMNADKFIESAAKKVLSIATVHKKTQQDSPNYLVMAALVGFVIIFFTIIITL